MSEADSTTFSQSICSLFNMDLRVSTLTFAGGNAHMLDLLDHAKLGIVVGSLLAGVLGFLAMHYTLPRTASPDAVAHAED